MWRKNRKLPYRASMSLGSSKEVLAKENKKSVG